MRRKQIIAACVVFVVLTLAIGGLGYRAKSDIEAVVTDQFNNQQLILAQQIAKDIREHIAFLRTCLHSLALLWRTEKPDTREPWPGAPALSNILAEWDVVALGVLRPGQPAPTYYDLKGQAWADAGLCNQTCRSLLTTEQAGRITVTRVFSPQRGPLAGRRLIALHLPLADPAGSGSIGMLTLVVDAQAVAARYAHAVRSGQSGYAWVVDDRGVFLDHYEPDFIGHESLKVREIRNPQIDWSQLKALLDTRILTGETGTGWYVSGWHRGRIGQVRKLVAFCPVALSGKADPGNRWAVALTAPVNEVRGLISRLLVREGLIIALFELVLFGVFVLVLHLTLRWSSSLSREVEKTSKELLAAQERLLRSERFAAIGEAAARLSHEIKNPLMLMGGFASQVRRHLPQDGPDFEKLGIVEAEAQRLESLLNEVRDFTRPAPPQIIPGNLNATVKESVELMSGAMQAHSIRVVLDLDRSLPKVPFDAPRIKQVLINLLKNAAEAMEQGGTVTIATRRNDRQAQVSITDTGGGIDEAVQDRLFDPFCTTKESGTGLGLTVCQRIVGDHHGEISHTPTPDGTTFTVSLPLNVMQKAGKDARGETL